MLKKLVVIPFLVIFSACQPPLTRDQQLAIYRSRCLDYGYEWGTPEFADCMMKQETHAENLVIQERKVSALEEQNWIEQQNMRAKEKEIQLKKKKLKHKRNTKQIN